MARRSFLAILALAFAGGLAFGAGQASANHVSCGDAITADTTLDSDLVNCENNGIVIGADDITLDLDGHRIDGDGELAEDCRQSICDVGVVNDGHDGVTVRHGSVREFGEGVGVGNARHVRILGISSSRNQAFGFLVFGSARSLVRNSLFSRNIAPEGDGIGMFGCRHVRIVNNEIRRNPGPGIHVEDSSDNLIKGNRFARTSDFGILMEGDRNRVRGDRFVRVGGGITVSGDRNAVARNSLRGGTVGVAVENGRGNLVAGNVVVDAREDGIYLGLNAPPIGGVDNVVRRNEVRGSGDDGFDVKSKDKHSVLKRNVAVASGDDGFDVDSRSTEAGKNRAERNGDLGINAVQGVIDGGGNRASGNGDPLQCVNVTCH